MTRLTAALAVLSLTFVACGDTDDVDSNDCKVSVQLFPAPGTTNAYYRTTVEATFSGEVDQSSVDLAVSGVNGTVTWRENTAVFQPADPFAATTDYSTVLSYDCAGEVKNPTADWRTSEVGASTPLEGLPGEVFALDLAGETVEVIEPEGIGGLIGDYLNFPIYLQITSADASELNILGAVGEEGSDEQAACTQTIDFPSAKFSENPFFEIGPADTTVIVSGVAVTIGDLNISGAFSPDASYIAGATLSGNIDTRPLVPIFGEGSDDPGTICDLAAALNVFCVPCTEDNEPFCLDIYARNIGAENVATEVTRIEDPCALEECAADPSCQD
jgi:hypothetical protein